MRAKAEKCFYYNFGDKKYTEISGYRWEYKNHTYFTLKYKSEKGSWAVIEAKSGLWIAKEYSRKNVEDLAIKNIDGSEAVGKSITVLSEKWILENGISPLYAPKAA